MNAGGKRPRFLAMTEIGHTHGYPLDIANRIFNYCSFDLKGKLDEFSLKAVKLFLENLKARPNDKCWTIQYVGCMLEDPTY